MTDIAEAEGLSLYGRIFADIRDAILSGAWPPGHRIPFESELAERYKCSRMTVNKALSQLSRAGLIERRRRSGSFVKQPSLQSAVLEIHDIKAEVQALGLDYRYSRTARRERQANESDRRRLDVPAGAPLLELECRHYAADWPFCMEERLISLTAVPEAAEESFEGVAPGPYLTGRIPWSAAEHTIRAVGADRGVAAGLRLAAGAPCLTIERRTWSAGVPVTQVRLTYPGNIHSLVARFTPSG
ncbi:MAG: histidine utilization repressor [Mesorhizobium sp.]|jgi:GntR family histidine utilization transcriptional repressor